MRGVLITGAQGGIGRALCRAFRGAGYWVLASDLSETPAAEPGASTANEAAEWDAFVAADLDRLARDEGDRSAFLAAVRQALGERPLRAVVNNAAVQVLRPTEDLRVEDWGRSFGVNVLAPFLLVQGLLPELRAAGGAVINLGSIHAELTKPGFVCYATSKAAVVGLTKSMAVDLGGTVRVNGINPAATATPMLLAGFEGRPDSLDALSAMHPIGRIAEPDEIAKAAVFLASEDASFVNGAILDVNGGLGARLHDPE